MRVLSEAGILKALANIEPRDQLLIFAAGLIIAFIVLGFIGRNKAC